VQMPTELSPVAKARLRTHAFGLFVDGEWREGSRAETSAIINPADEKSIGTVAVANDRDVQLALASATKGFTLWQKTSVGERAKILFDATTYLKETASDIAQALTREQGKTLRESHAEVGRAIKTIEWTAANGAANFSKTYASSNGDRYTRPIPLGIVAAFSPWNYPAVVAARKLAPALIAGSSVILKAAEETPAAVVAIVDALHRAGLPRGVVNLLFGRPDRVAKRLLESGLVRVLTFTGSTAVGKQLAAHASRHLVRCVLELGGHAPVFVDNDIDVTTVAEQLCAFKFRCAGQSCVAPSRVFVHEEIFDTFLRCLTDAASSLRVGNGLDDDVQMGPVANYRRMEAMQRLTNDATARGARCVAGGRRAESPGFFWEPTLFVDIPPEAELLHEEPFGPIASVIPFSNLSDAIVQSNRNRYGLAGYVFTRSQSVAANVANTLDVGLLSINAFEGMPEDAPVSGIKDSGYGSEGGMDGIASYMYSKLVIQKSL
jgi:succinate-semialdehyde dehydrogenase/glutarate-semialdehyde dehydrogenase